MMIIDNKYELNQIVYLITDTDNKPRMVVGFLVDVNQLLYKLASGTAVSYNSEIEISTEKNIQ